MPIAKKTQRNERNKRNNKYSNYFEPIPEPERDCEKEKEGGAAPWDRPGLMGLEKSRGGNCHGPHTQRANAGADQSGAGVSERVHIETYFVGDKVIINTARGERDTTSHNDALSPDLR